MHHLHVVNYIDRLDNSVRTLLLYLKKMYTLHSDIFILYCSVYSVKGNQVWRVIKKAFLKESIAFLCYIIYSTVAFCCFFDYQIICFLPPFFPVSCTHLFLAVFSMIIYNNATSIMKHWCEFYFLIKIRAGSLTL